MVCTLWTVWGGGCSFAGYGRNGREVFGDVLWACGLVVLLDFELVMALIVSFLFFKLKHELWKMTPWQKNIMRPECS